MKTNYFSRIRNFLSQDRARQREEAYLGRSVSRLDLERREREIEIRPLPHAPLVAPATGSKAVVTITALAQLTSVKAWRPCPLKIDRAGSVEALRRDMSAALGGAGDDSHER